MDYKTPTPPIKLTKAQKKIWDIVTKELAESQDLSILDYPSITAYCLEMDLYFSEMEVVGKEGAVIEMDNGKSVIKIQSPHYKNAVKALTSAKNLADRFGLNSASRKKLKMEKVIEDKKDPLDGII